MSDRVERTRRQNEACDDPGTMLRRGEQCKHCAKWISKSGIFLSGRWLHLDCVDSYIIWLEKTRNEAIDANDQLRQTIERQNNMFGNTYSYPMSPMPLNDGVWYSTLGDTTTVGQGWFPAGGGVLTSTALPTPGAVGGGGATIYAVPNNTGAQPLTIYTVANNAGAQPPMLYTSTGGWRGS